MEKLHSFTPITQSHFLPSIFSPQTCYIWTVPKIKPFNELLLSWNADRPLKGQYVFLSSVLIRNQWTPWLLYSVWGVHGQYSFDDFSSHAPVHSFQDQIEILDEETASGFRIRIEASGGAQLDKFYSLYACTSNLKWIKSHPSLPTSPSLLLPVSGLSQIDLKHPRSNSLCSPTSTTAVIHYLLKSQRLNPLQFAQQVYDSGFDIYGNWSFNVAQAFIELGFKWHCYCARTAGFKTIEYYLKKGLPVVVSVKGTLTGSLIPYTRGHLLVIKGYDTESRQVLCMDPAFSLNEQTSVKYSWDEFKEAWKNRYNLGYFFTPKPYFKNKFK